MLELKTVLPDFTAISGLTTEEAKKQTNLINLAIGYVMRSLKPGVDVKMNEDILSMLAASVAYHKYILIKESLNSTSSIKLGDLAVNSNPISNIKMAENLKNEFISLAGHLLLSPNFIFRQV